MNDLRGVSGLSGSASGPGLPGRSIALVHEWFSETGGSENVFVAMTEVFPQATPFVLWREPEATRGVGFRESWMARTPLRHSKALALPVMPLAWRTLVRGNFDLVLSSSHAFAHTVKTRSPGTRYLSYVHTPARYLWSPEFDGRGANNAFSVPRSLLQAADVRLSRHVTSYAANSSEVRSRIRRFWNRDACVIYPPVDVGYFSAPPPWQGEQNRDYLLGVGRWVPYKRFDFMIQVAEAARIPLVIAGSGPEETALRQASAKATIPVTFENRPSRQRIRELYWGARALLFPAHEDFGIIPVEAQACGTPVVGLRRGGLLETVVEGETGFLIDSYDPLAYVSALRHVLDFDRQRIIAHASAFSTEAFKSKIFSWVRDELG
jgi:glycosyltransferase involved in cell wall biosynthesis